MKAFTPIPLSMLLLGCASVGPLNADEMFAADGVNPDWGVSLGQGGIRLGIGHFERHQISPQEVVSFPMVRGHHLGDAYVWESAENGRRIVVEARHRPCRSADGRGFTETVRVRLDDREFEGCGNRQILVRG